MKLAKVLLLQRGVSSKTGKLYCRISVRSKKADGTSAIAEFWLGESVITQISEQGIIEDDFVNLSVELNENLRPEISKVEKVANTEDAIDLIYNEEVTKDAEKSKSV